MGVAKARLLQPLEYLSVPINKTALVVGGGLAGMTPHWVWRIRASRSTWWSAKTAWAAMPAGSTPPGGAAWSPPASRP